MSINKPQKTGMFVTFVDRILHFSQHLTSFRLVGVHPYGVSNVRRWVSTALRHDLESLELDFLIEGVTFPCSLLNSTSLRKLNLNFSCTLYVAAKNFAPNLTCLHLNAVDMSMTNGNKNTSTVAFTFPVLETFSVRACNSLNVKFVEIYAPSLTTFVSEPLNCEDEYDYSFVIHAPKLAKFECPHVLLEKFVLINGSSSVSCAIFDCDGVWDKLIKDNGLRFRKLLNEFTSLEELEISLFLAGVSFLRTYSCADVI